jgi:hypothetical protein
MTIIMTHPNLLAWQASIQRKRKKTSNDMGGRTAKQLKQTKTSEKLESESADDNADKCEYAYAYVSQHIADH